MSTLLLLTLPFLAILALIIIGAIWLTNQLADRFVGQKHRLLEEIMETGEMPLAWTSTTQTSRQIGRKLNSLIKYAQTTPLIADEETRQQLLAQLNKAQADWLDQTENGTMNRESSE